MHTRLIAAFAAGLLAVPALVSLAGAEPQVVSGDALRQMIIGRTLMLHTPVGKIPIAYRDNGTMIGRAKDLQLYTGLERDKGRWWVRGDQVCQKWDNWLEGRAYCFSWRLEGQVVHWRRDDGRTGTATLASN